MDTHNDLHPRIKRLDSQRHPRDQPSPSHGDHHGVDVFHLLHDLQPQGALARQDVGVVISDQRLNITKLNITLECPRSFLIAYFCIVEIMFQLLQIFTAAKSLILLRNVL